MGWIRMHKSVPKVPKVLTFGKVSQKIQKSGGGSDLFWTKSKLKLHFFWEAPLLPGSAWLHSRVGGEIASFVGLQQNIVISGEMILPRPIRRLPVWEIVLRTSDGLSVFILMPYLVFFSVLEIQGVSKTSPSRAGGWCYTMMLIQRIFYSRPVSRIPLVCAI